MNRALYLCIVFAIGSAGPLKSAGPDYKAGVAKKVITPAEPMWMAGYAARNKPSEGKAHDLYAKALAQKGDLETGIRVLREARLRAPGDGGLRWALASALAKAGRKVLVLERRPFVGGCCITEEI